MYDKEVESLIVSLRVTSSALRLNDANARLGNPLSQALGIAVSRQDSGK